MRTTDPARDRRRARSDRQAGLAEREGSRRRAHADAVGCDRQCGIYDGEAVADVPPSCEDLQRGERRARIRIRFSTHTRGCWRCGKRTMRCGTGGRRTSTRKTRTFTRFCGRTGETTVLVALNMSAKTQTLKLDWASRGVQASGAGRSLCIAGNQSGPGEGDRTGAVCRGGGQGEVGPVWMLRTAPRPWMSPEMQILRLRPPRRTPLRMTPGL